MRRRAFISSLLGGLGLGISARRSAAVEADEHRVVIQESPLAGFDHHKGAHIWPFLKEGASLRLVREAANPHDRNAVAVYFNGDKLGYIPRRENVAVAQLLDRGQKLVGRVLKLRDEPNPWRRVRFSVELVAQGLPQAPQNFADSTSPAKGAVS